MQMDEIVLQVVKINGVPTVVVFIQQSRYIFLWCGELWPYTEPNYGQAQN
jgi:hypothetical protein